MATTNGQRDPVQEASEMEAASTGIQSAFERAEEGSLEKKYLNELLQSELSPDRKRILHNLLSRDFALGNLTESEAHEVKWQLWVIRERFLAMHPDQDSEVYGVLRASVHRDGEAGLRPLTQQEQLQVDQFFQGVWQRVTRSKDFKQQEILSTSISESYVQRGDTEDSGGIFGRFG